MFSLDMDACLVDQVLIGGTGVGMGASGGGAYAIYIPIQQNIFSKNKGFSLISNNCKVVEIWLIGGTSV
jgi:hypothetical protein